MFVFNCKLKDSKRWTAVFLISSLIFAVICIACMVSAHGGASDKATCDELGEYSLSAQTESEQKDLLDRFGLRAEKIVSRDEITIPSEFNATYEKYNELQVPIGLDLRPYKGKTAERVIYEIHSDKAEYAVLLVYNGKFIGGHLTNGEYGDENLPLI